MLVSLKKVSRFHGNHLIFKDISFDIQAGSITLLAGANGAGKTSLLHILAGLSNPSTGTIIFANNIRPATGLVGHETFIYPELSAVDNLLFWCKLHGLPLDSKKCEHYLGKVDLLPFAREKAGTFSRGMAQRLSLARVFMIKPKLLLMDEPSTGLDTKSVRILYDSILESKKDGAAIVWISHNILGDLPLADKVLLIEKKKLGFFGEAHEFANSPYTDKQTAEAAC